MANPTNRPTPNRTRELQDRVARKARWIERNERDLAGKLPPGDREGLEMAQAVYRRELARDQEELRALAVVAREGHYALTAGGDLIAHVGTEYEYVAGCVSDPENLLTAIDAHEEEVRVLLADARREFGL